MCRFPAPANCSISFDADLDGPVWMLWLLLKWVLYVTTCHRDLDHRDPDQDPDRCPGPNLGPYHRHRTALTNGVDRLREIYYLVFP